MQALIRQVNTQGQVSVGMKFAGQKVQIEEYADGSVILTPVEVVSAFELKLMRDQMFQNRLVEFDKWESENPAIEAELDGLLKQAD